MAANDGLQWDRATNKVTPVTLASDERNKKMSRKKQLKRAIKGLVQDSLHGTRTPEAAGIFTETGEQSLGYATGTLRNPGSTVPANQSASSVPGVTQALQGGQSAYEIPAEGYLTRKEQKAMKKRNRAVLKSLSRLELLASQLPAKHPARMRAASIVLRSKLALQAGAQQTGSIQKAVSSLVGNGGDIDPASEIVASLGEVERALGISSSAAPWSAGSLNARSQLERIVGGGQSESLGRFQDSAAAAVGGPMARLGQVLKSGIGEQIARAEEEVRKAEAGSDSARLAIAQQDLTYLRLRAAHMVRGVN